NRQLNRVTVVWCVRDVKLLHILQDNKTSAPQHTGTPEHQNGTSEQHNSNEQPIVQQLGQAMEVDIPAQVDVDVHIYVTDTKVTHDALAELQAQYGQKQLHIGRPKLSHYMTGDSDVVVCGPKALLRHTRDVYRTLVKSGVQL